MKLPVIIHVLNMEETLTVIQTKEKKEKRIQLFYKNTLKGKVK